MDTDIMFDCTALNGPPYELLAEVLTGRIDGNISVADDVGLVAETLKKRGCTIDRSSDYGDMLTGSCLDPEKMQTLFAECPTQWVLAVAESSDTCEKSGITPGRLTRLELRDALNQTGFMYTYKTIASGDVGCFVVSCGGREER